VESHENQQSSFSRTACLRSCGKSRIVIIYSEVGIGFVEARPQHSDLKLGPGTYYGITTD
jgi:hypothetical protein